MKLKSLLTRPEARFLTLFLAILAISFTIVALKPVDDSVVMPYIAFVARMAAVILAILGEDISTDGAVLQSPRFAVTIYNGCNGLITSLIFVSGVVAFPSRLSAKVIGVIAGLLAIQAINLIRVVSLFYIGVFLPQFFNQSHVVVWQSLVILAGITLWILWAHRFATPQRSAR
jgi:exosortase H (IPTLxxWG-CTERM-specific)